MFKSSSLLILRIGLAITFIWIGIAILNNPKGWGEYVLPSIKNILPLPIEKVMITNGILDILIGVFLLLDYFVFVGAFLGIIHLLVVVLATGLNDITIRDVGLLGGIIAIFIETMPKEVMGKYFKKVV